MSLLGSDMNCEKCFTARMDLAAQMLGEADGNDGEKITHCHHL